VALQASSRSSGTGRRPWVRCIRRRGRSFAVGAVSALLVASMVACGPNRQAAQLSQGPVASIPVSAEGVSYGPDPAQLLDIHQPEVSPPVGVIIWLHAGGWISETRAHVSDLIASQTERGWAVVSIDYRLAPAVHAEEMLSDIDRAVRWVRVHGAEYGLDTSTVVVAGGSAGGHLAAMAGAAAGQFVDPALPPELRAVSSVPEGIIDLVGPSDLTTFAEVGGWAPDTSSQLLGCALGATTLALPPCDQATAARFSPLWWARQAVASGTPLPPAILAYGPEDLLVPPATQGDPLYSAWDAAAPTGSTHYDLPLGAGHNLEPDLDRPGFERWLDLVAAHAF
jgi:acetyl esterase/lipase